MASVDKILMVDMYLCEITTTQTYEDGPLPVGFSRQVCCLGNCPIWKTKQKGKKMYYVFKRENCAWIFKCSMHNKEDAEHHMEQMTKSQDCQFMVIEGNECKLKKRTCIVDDVG
jgi:hypothetical protein